MMHLNRVWPTIGALFLLFSTSVVLAKGNSADAPGRLYGLGQPHSVNDLPPGQFKSTLEGLSPKARGKALGWLQRFSFPVEDLTSIRVDSEGSIFYAEVIPQDAGDSSVLKLEAQGSIDSTHIVASAIETASMPEATADSAAADPQTVFKLHSRPGSSNVVFLDFDGHTLQNTVWNDETVQSLLVALPFDPSQNDSPATVANFTQFEMNGIAEIWHRVASDFAAFDIDVTTEEPAVFTPTMGRILITHDIDANGRLMPLYNSVGIAHVDVFGLSNYAYYSPVLVYYTNLFEQLQGDPPLVAEMASHGFGHHLGLSHDGVTGGTAYYPGHGLGLVDWAPIMGDPFVKDVTQWDQGEYAGANNPEDDLAIIAGHLGYIGDDHADSPSQATALAVDADGTILVSSPELDPDNVLTENKGVIGDRDDVDWFYLDVTGSGTLQITATPSWHSFTRRGSRGENLDIELSLFDSSLNLIVADEPGDETDATVTAAVNPGRYYLQLDGVGNNTLSDYSDYGSAGMFFIEGTVPTDGAPSDTTPPAPAQMSWQSPPTATGTSSISMTAVTATDDSGYVEYYFACTSGNGCNSSNWQTSPTYTDSGLQADTTYSYFVIARDAAGNTNNSSAAASATTDTSPTEDTTPPSPAQMSWQSPPTATGTSSISMTAVTATDDSGYVEYYFACTSGNGCNSSNWQTNPTYTDNGLQADTTYSYFVIARDAAGNTNNSSAAASATTDTSPTEDTTPPSPAQMSWQTPPHATGTSSISMTAVTATDDSGYVEYYFACTSGNGCNSSNWQTSPTYTDNGLQADTTYSYFVIARDAAGNTNNISSTASATTDDQGTPTDTTPPSPAQMSWQSPPTATGTSSISMTAVTATDDSGSVEYYFTCVSGGPGCNSSGWQASSTFTDNGLQADTSYSYSVRARDAAGNMNNASAAASATTDEATDTTPPSPAQMSWQSPPAATSTSTISMTAVMATDNSGSVEYYFTCVSGGSGCSSSGWQASRNYTDSGLQANTSYSYSVRARDAAGNTNNASAASSATTESQGNSLPIAVASYSPNPAQISKGKSIQVTLSGTGSSDPDGSITAWSWRNSSGSVVSTASSFTVSLREGNHNYTLTVTDNQSATGTTEIIVSVWGKNDTPDTTPPAPSQMSWQSPPSATGTSSISMTAVLATDASGSVQYAFTCVSGGSGCSNSGWQASRTFTDNGLQAATSYSYRVQARDAAGNTNNISATASATTDGATDTTPPSPTTMSWQSPPSATGTSSISMTAVLATDASGSVEYAFTCVSGGSGCSNSGWQASRTFTDNGLQAATSYSYRVQARDAAGNTNNISATASATTDGATDTTPPSPTTMSWQSPPSATGTSSISMTAVLATDASGSVEYAFTCVSGGSGCSNSGWRTNRTWTDSGLQADTTYSYRVQARDAAGNTNNVSAMASATTDGAANNQPTAVASYSPNPAQITKGKWLNVTLNGTDSYDSDGSITDWSWKDQSGSVISTSSNHTVRLREGSYSYTLTVTDNDGASDASAITVTVLGK